MKKTALRIWHGWKKIALKIARFNAALLLTLFYFLILAPVGAIFKLFGWDPLRAKRRHHSKSTNWDPVVDGEPDIQSLRRQS